MDNLTIYDTVAIFIHIVLRDIRNEKEIPGINFIFNQESIDFIKHVKDNYKPLNINYPELLDEDIKLLNKYDESFFNIKVTDPLKFFTMLTNICKNECKLERDYKYKSDVLYIAPIVLRRIWLRCTALDIECIEGFLERQNDFLENRELDTFNNSGELGTLLGNEAFYRIFINQTYCESSRKFDVKLENPNFPSVYHDLPSIYYDIRNEDNKKVCYIYAVQNAKDRDINKKVERSLYKLNSGCNNGIASVHPSFTASMLLFNRLLKSHNIDTVKVPLLEVLNYDYHVLLSKYTNAHFHLKWDRLIPDVLESYKEIDMELYNQTLKEYEKEKLWHEHVVGKEDFISKNKTDNLYNLFYYLDSLNYIDIDGINLDDELSIKLLNK